MSLPLFGRSKLFFNFNGQLQACWYLSYASLAEQNFYIDDMDRWGIDWITLCLCNENLGIPFRGEFMRSDWDWGKVNNLLNFCDRLKARGKKIAIVFFDCPPDAEAPYQYWKYWMQDSRLTDFIQVATMALAPIVDAFILAIESNRGPLAIELVEQGIWLIQQYARRTVNGQIVQLPVGTHEQNVSWKYSAELNRNVPYLTRRVARTAKFHGLETSNHPVTGSLSVVEMVEEVSFVASHSVNEKGEPIPVWVMEKRSAEDDLAKKQGQELAQIPNVWIVEGVM